MKKNKIWKLHEASVQRFSWGSSQLSYLLKPPIRKAIFKRVLRQRFYLFNPTQWLNYTKTGYPIFIGKYLKPVQIGLFQMPALSFYKLVKSGHFFFHANYRIPVCNTTTKCFEFELITLPCKYELMSVRIEVVLNEAILHRSSSYFFCSKWKFPM